MNGSNSSRPLPEPQQSLSKPNSILKNSSRDDADAISKFNDKPRVAFMEDAPPVIPSDPTLILNQPEQTVKKKANLTIRPEEETRVILALQKASKKQATGSLFSVVVDISKNGTLDIGVKDLPENLLVVSLLKRGNGFPGAAEEAGIRLGDVIFGINFIPTREGSKTLITVIKLETEKKKRFLHIQAWRCHQLCSDTIPGYLFPRADDMFIRGYDLYQNKVFSDWERWNFVEIILGYMVEDLHVRAQNTESQESTDDAKAKLVTFAQTGRVRARQMQALDLEKNILQAKGLRSAISVRIVHTKTKDDVVTYILRVEDVESGLVWVVTRRYNEFYALYEELNESSHFIRELEFPRKRLTLRLSARVIEQRVTMLEQYIRRALHLLTLNASVDSSASHALRRVQHFLSVEKHVDCIHPPIVDDQRAIELMAYLFLNDFNSPACQQCVRFTSSVELEGMIEAGEDGYRGLLTFMHDALAEVEQFVQQQHEHQLISTIRSRRPEWSEDQQLKLVRQCIRRQVEAALYLPLRRPLVRLLLAALDVKLKQLQRSIALLQLAKPSVFMVDPMITKTRSFPKAIKSFRRALLAHLPSDQGQFLVEAAMAISEVHTECKELARTSRRLSLSLSPKAGSSSSLAALAAHEAALASSTFQPSDQRTFSTIRDDTRMVSIDDPTWAYDSEDSKQRGSFGRNHNSTSGGSNRAAQSTTRRSITERVSHFLMADASSTTTTSRSSILNSQTQGPERRPSLSSATQSVVNQQIIDEDELEMGLGEETQRVSFNIGAATSSMMLLNIQSEEGSSSSSASTNMSSSAQKISSYVPKREHTTSLIEKQALANELQQQGQQQSSSYLDPKRILFSTAEVGQSLNESESSRSSESINDVGESEEAPSFDQAIEDSSSEGSKPSSASEISIDEKGGPAKDHTELETRGEIENSAATAETTNVLPPLPQKESAASQCDTTASSQIISSAPQYKMHTSTSTSSSALFDSDDETPDPLNSQLNSATNSGKEETIVAKKVPAAVRFASDVDPLSAATAVSNNTSNNRLSTRQLDRTSSRKSEIVDPLLRPPDEHPQRRENSAGSTAIVDSTIFAEVFDRYRSTYDPLGDDQGDSDEEGGVNAISADDFLPIFTFVVVHAQVPQMLLLKELMVALIANEDAYGECGYYLATFEAALQHVNDLASQYGDIARQDGFLSERQASHSVADL